MKYASNNIRNILIAGHAGSGKTTLTEALVYFSGAAERMGRVEDGTTISDFDPEEAKRKASLSASVVPVEYEGIKYNLIDAPGLFDFEAGEYEGIRAAESVLVVVSGRSTWICLPPSYLKAFWLNRLMYTGVPSSSLAGTTQGQTVEPNLIFISSRILK